MKRVAIIAGVLFLMTQMVFSQEDDQRDNIEIDLNQYQSADFAVSALSCAETVKKETYVSQVFYPEVEVKKYRRFRPKKGKTYTEEDLSYAHLTPEDALESMIKHLNEKGHNALYGLRITEETKNIKKYKGVSQIPGYRVEGVALEL